MVDRLEDGAAVLDALRTGGAGALSGVYARWSPLVHSLALRSLADVGAAEQVTREVFTGLRVALEADADARADFPHWLVDLVCARIDAARAAGAPPVQPGQVDPDDSAPGESRTAALAERLLMIDELAHLDADPQGVLRLVLSDVGTAEVAERTGTPLEDVRDQVAASLVELSQRWEVRTDARRD